MEKFLNIIEKFIEKMGYRENSTYLGVYFYGSSLTGFNKVDSDIDLHVIFDESAPDHLYRGVSFIDGVKIEYFEKCISDVYLSVKNDLTERNWSWYSIVGTSHIIDDNNGELEKLRKYTLDIYKNVQGMDEEDTYERISIINNRMEKLRKCVVENSPNFYSLFYITIEKIRRFYHGIHGFPKINTSKIYRIYKDDEYRKSYFPNSFVTDEFKKLYFGLIENESRDKKELFKLLEEFYSYVLDNRHLEKEFKIHIKSHNK